MRNRLTSPRKDAFRQRLRASARNRTRPAVRQRHSIPFWANRPNPAAMLTRLLRKIVAFHESQPLLMRHPAAPPPPPNRSENGQFRTDFSNPAAPATEPSASSQVNSSPDPGFRSGNGQFRTDSPKPDWHAIAERFRAEEWDLYRDIMRVARSITAELHNHPRRVSLTQLTSLIHQACQLGRRACGLPLDHTPAPPAPSVCQVDFAETLNRIYGKLPQPAPPSTNLNK